MISTLCAASTSEAEIRQLIEDWAEAVRTRDSTRLATWLAPDAILFDVINPLQYSGADTVKQRTEAWLSSFQGPIGYEIRDLRIVAGEDTAFCHSLNRVSGTNMAGTRIQMWWRATVCFERREQGWVVTHEHNSVPFDVSSGRASLDLRP